MRLILGIKKESIPQNTMMAADVANDDLQYWSKVKPIMFVLRKDPILPNIIVTLIAIALKFLKMLGISNERKKRKNNFTVNLLGKDPQLLR